MVLPDSAGVGRLLSDRGDIEDHDKIGTSWIVARSTRSTSHGAPSMRLRAGRGANAAARRSGPVPSSAMSPIRGVGHQQNGRDNPMLLDMLQAPRCRATSKRSGERCPSPAVKGWSVCRRMHGAGGGAPGGNSNALKHGLYTNAARAEQRQITSFIGEARAIVGSINAEG
jgi:hypothetical protein